MLAKSQRFKSTEVKSQLTEKERTGGLFNPTCSVRPIYWFPFICFEAVERPTKKRVFYFEWVDPWALLKWREKAKGSLLGIFLSSFLNSRCFANGNRGRTVTFYYRHGANSSPRSRVSSVVVDVRKKL